MEDGLLEVGGGGWVPDTPGKVNLVTAEPICTNLEFGCENESTVTEFGVENGQGLRLGEGNDPLASWSGIEFGDLLARADMGRTEPLLDFSSDSVRCSSSSFFVPGNGDVVTVDVHRWASSSKHVSQSGSVKGGATEVEAEQKLDNDQTQKSTVVITIPEESPGQEQGEKEIPDLNATPQQKQRRRKHRPKVIIEGKTKISRKQTTLVSTPKSSEAAEKRKYVQKKTSGDTDNPTGKRKYVRKKTSGNADDTAVKRKYVRKMGPPKPSTESSEMVERKGSKYTKKSARKVLSFDSDSKENGDRLRPAAGDKANPIVLSDTDSEQEHEFTVIADCRHGKQHGETMGKENDRSHTFNPLCRGHVSVSEAQNSSFHMNEQHSTDGPKHTPANVNLADLVNHKRDENSSTTSSTSSTVTNARNNGKLAKEWWHCDPKALPSAPNTMFQNSVSREIKEVTDTRPAKDASVEISSLTNLSGNQASLNSHIQGEGKSCIAATPSKDEARLARINRIQKRKHANNLQSQGVDMGQLHKDSHFIPIAPHPDAIWEYLISVEDIVKRLQDLDINRETGTQHQRCNALVPFKAWYQTKSIHISRRNQREEQKELVIYGHDGTLIPFDGSQNKKRRPRAKVDLDEETSRVWRLLLENINSQGVDGTDEEKARWWENERKVFSGRANSFIARMHLVQGDRRFSKWKGSVVDSVVGVFLTQNVSDHLSSSAFMSLAARFPLKPNCDDEPFDKDDTCSANEKFEIHVMHPEDSVTLDNEISNGPISGASNSGAMSSTDESNCKLSAFGSQLQKFVETMGNKKNNNSAAEMPCVTVNNRSQLDDVVSSQSSATTYESSLESSPSDRTSLSSERNVVVDPAAMSIPKAYGGSTSFLELLHMVGCPGNQEGSLKGCTEDEICKSLQNGPADIRLHDQLGNETDKTNESLSSSLCKEDEICKSLQNGPADIRLHDQLRNETDKTNESPSSSVELGILSSDHGAKDARFDPIEVESLRTPGKDIMSLEISSDEEGSKISKQACLECMPQMSKNITYEAPRPSVLEGESNTSHGSSGQRDGIDMTECSTVVLVDQDHNEVGKRGLRSLNMTSHLTDTTKSTKSSNSLKATTDQASNTVVNKTYASDRAFYESNINSLKAKRRRVGKDINHTFDWEGLRKETQVNGKTRGKTPETMDSLDYEAVRSAEVGDIAYTIRDRGMNNVLAGRIKDFLNRLVNEHGSIDLEWLRDVPPDQAKEYLLSIRGLGLKSVECVRLLTLHHLAFPVDTNVGRIAVRLGWVPLQPLPESLQLHLLEMYPMQESIQKYLWPRLCKLDQKTLYELHYQMITFGKVFCTKSKPNCNSCPMRGECRHFASAFASARLALPGPEEKRIVPLTELKACNQSSSQVPEGLPYQAPLLPHIVFQQQDPPGNLQISHSSDSQSRVINCEPIIEEPKSPEIECVQIVDKDIEDGGYEESDEIPEIKLNIEEFAQSLQRYINDNMELEEGDVSKALVALTPEAASIPAPKLKSVSMLRTEHHVYELPDSHPLIEGLDRREPDDPCSYLLAIWTPGETATSIQPPEACASGEIDKLCDKETCFSCNSLREANSHTVRGTLLIPCRTAMRGSFPLNGTYFQVNEVFADHDSSLNPMNIPRKWIWNLPRRTVYFGTSIPTIFKGLSTEGIQQCFWRGYVCVRGFDQKTRAPRPLLARLHFPASKTSRTRGKPSGE
ncbi:unnamed protein product [Rhodiola kirilowii]